MGMRDIQTILAWAVNPGFFWAGAALVSIPIIIHLLNRRRFKVVQWAAMQYLLAALRKNRRRLKFEQWLLLAVRCLMLGLLGLALARPIGCADSTIAALAAQRAGLHVFVIDNSYSMAYEAHRPDARTHLDQAKLLARRQIEQLSSGAESVALILAGRAAQRSDRSTTPTEGALLLRPSYDLDAARAAVDRIRQSWSGTDLPAALAEAIRIAREEQRQPNKRLYILTDGTRSAFAAPAQAALLANLGPQLTEVFGRNIRLHHLGRPDQWNHAILDLAADSALVAAGFHSDFLATVRGFGAAEETLLQWRWDEQVLPDSVRLTPDDATPPQRQTRVQLGAGGPHLLSALLYGGEDRLKVDNLRHRVVQVASELKVLIVEGTRGAGLLSGSGAYLDLSLAPKKEMGPGGIIRSSTYVVPEVISDLEIGGRVLNDYRAVILTNVAALAQPQARQIQQFVQQGGTLMVFMGEQVNAEAYNSGLLPLGLMPGRLIARKTTSGDESAFHFDFNPNGPLHPLLNIFRGEEKSGLDTARIYAYIAMELDPAAQAEVVLSYLIGQKPTGDPAITRHSLGQGQVVVITTTADSQWNALPQKPAYIPLVHELLAGTVDVGERWLNLTVGQPLELPPGLRLLGPPRFFDPENKPIALEAESRGSEPPVYRSAPLENPGVYRLELGGRVIPVAVNVPPDEADIRVMPAAALRQALGNIELDVYGDSLPVEALASNDSSDFGWTLMLLLLIVAGVESALALRFGHYRRPAAGAEAAG